MTTTADAPLLSLVDVTKRFPGQVALAGARLDVAPGEVHALLGQNGSGKSTLIKVLAGYYTADDFGAATMGGTAFKLGSTAEAERLGMRFIHQNLGLVEGMSAVENCALSRGFPTGRAWRIHWQAERRRVGRLLEQFGVDVDPNQPIGKLKPAERTMVAIVRALQDWDESVRLLVLDEPTATLPAGDVRRLFEVVRRVTAAGIGVLFVSHRLDEVFEIADRVTVLRDGRTVLTQDIGSLDRDRLISAMIGGEVDEWFSEPPPPTNEPILQVEGLGGRDLRSLSLRLLRGEIVGFAGLIGSGRDEIAPLLFGALPRTAGSVAIDGRRLDRLTPGDAMAAGVALVPADRGKDGAVTTFTVRENLTLPRLRPLFRRGLLQRRAERTEYAKWADTLDIRPRRSDADFFQLSGGNQQKVVLAKCLRLEPSVLILDEPTQGVDVGAKSAIYRILTDSARTGLAVVVCSSDSEELAHLCDRVLVIADGEVSVELAGGALTPARIEQAVLRSKENS